MSVLDSTGAPGRPPVRLLNVFGSFYHGGTEGQAVSLALALQRNTFEMQFACLDQLGPLAEAARQRGLVREYALRSFASTRYVRQVLRLARDIKRDRIDLVQSYGFACHMLAIPAARLAGVRVVASVRDCGVYLTRNQRRLQRYLLSLVDCVLVNATAVKAWLVDQGCDADRIVVIPNGVNMARFEQPQGSTQPQASIREEFGFAPDAPLVVVVARIARAKGIEYLIEAAPAILAQHPQTGFLLVGPNSGELERITQRIEAQRLTRQIRIAGDRIDVPAILSQATISVLPSLSEAMPNSVLEAMTARVPVVATRVGGIPEAIEHGRNGLLVPPADAPAIAAAVNRLLANPAEAAGFAAAAHDTIVQRFSLEQMLRATSNVYLHLASRDRGFVSTPSGLTASRRIG